jgi:hypothetical protein
MGRSSEAAAAECSDVAQTWGKFYEFYETVLIFRGFEDMLSSGN